MSSIGYYRYKLDSLTEGTHYITFYINGSPVAVHTAVIDEWNTEKKLVKFLDKNGQYIYQQFGCYWEGKDSPKSLGTVNKFVTSILDSQTSQKQVGFKNERSISMVADNVSQEQLALLSDVFTSTRVYLHIGELNSDDDSDWIQVQQAGDNVIRRRKGIAGNVSLKVTLPEWASISML